jgi:4-methyl-5(b-hydroxyethyl)-thiazole monophosphate biosynthesis
MDGRWVSMKAYVMLAEGFEEIEALTVVDVLRRAQVDTFTVAVGNLPGMTGPAPLVTGSHGIPVVADRRLEGLSVTPEDLVVLPGGMPGTRHLQEDASLARLLENHRAADGWLGAICAAPSVPGKLGLLKGLRSTSFPGFEKDLIGAVLSTEPVVRDGRIVTSRGAGTALLFSLALVAALKGQETADRLAESMQVPKG